MSSETNSINKLKLTVKLGMSMKSFKYYWSVIYHCKGLEKGYSMVMFSKTLSETITISVFANIKLLVSRPSTTCKMEWNI